MRWHDELIYCPAVWGNGTASPDSGKQVNWTHVATSLATLSVEFSHFVGYTVDDFYCMMADPMVPSDGTALSVSTMAAAHRQPVQNGATTLQHLEA